LYFNHTFRQPIPGLKHIEFCPFCEKKDKKVLFEGGLHLACCRSNPTRYSPHNRTIQVLRHFEQYANLVDSVGEWMYNCNSSGHGKFLDAHFRGSIAVNSSRRDFNLVIDVSFVDPFAKSYENSSPDEVLVSKEKLKKLKYQNFATGPGHILILFIIGIGAGWGMDTKILLQRFLVGLLDHFVMQREGGTSMYTVFLNTLVATS